MNRMWAAYTRRADYQRSNEHVLTGWVFFSIFHSAPKIITYEVVAVVCRFRKLKKKLFYSDSRAGI